MTFQQDAFQDDAFDAGGSIMSGAFWSYQIDGYELNDYVNFVVDIPEIDNESEDAPVFVNIDGDYPVFIRLQPSPTTLSLNVQIVPSDWQTYNSRVAWLKALIAGDMHTLTVQARGMTGPKSIRVVATSIAMGDPRTRRLAVQLQAPNPHWT